MNLPRARVDAVCDDVANLRVFAIHDHRAVAVTVKDLGPLLRPIATAVDLSDNISVPYGVCGFEQQAALGGR